MGRDKAWVGVRGSPLIAHAVDKITALGVQGRFYFRAKAGRDFAARKPPVLFDLSRVWSAGGIGARCMNINRCWCSRWICPARWVSPQTHGAVRPADRRHPQTERRAGPLAAIYPNAVMPSRSARLPGHATRRGVLRSLLAGSCRPDFSIPAATRGVFTIATAPQMLEERTYRDRGQKNPTGLLLLQCLQCCANGQSTSRQIGSPPSRRDVLHCRCGR